MPHGIALVLLWRTSWSVWTGFWVLAAIVMGVSPDSAMSNTAEWLRAAGFEEQAQYFSPNDLLAANAGASTLPNGAAFAPDSQALASILATGNQQVLVKGEAPQGTEAAESAPGGGVTRPSAWLIVLISISAALVGVAALRFKGGLRTRPA
jgi:hypothetical protein